VTDFSADDGHGPVTSYGVKNWIGMGDLSIFTTRSRYLLKDASVELSGSRTSHALE
jgi:hypothetical protein